MNYDTAYNTLMKYFTKPNLIKHAVAVSEAMRHFAKIEGEDEEYWAVVGLLHDIDYELYPEEHCFKGVQMLRDEGFDDKFIHAFQSHAYDVPDYNVGVEPTCTMELILCTVDQLTGFIIACALMKPDKKLSSVDVAGISKKWKEKKFAAGTCRDRIMRFCDRLGKDFDYIAGETLKAMQGIADKLEL